MDRCEIYELCKKEESIAHIKGWDFSHINDRYREECDIPWNYKKTVEKYLKACDRLLDIDTGGGEFLLSLGHDFEKTAATENYPPNIKLCEEIIIPLGIDFKAASGTGILPFSDGEFDVVINRHGDFDPSEIYRILTPGGIFVTQQVGAENDRELVELLLGDIPVPFPDQYLKIAEKSFLDAGFEILESGEHFGKIEFFDIGALTWFARIIEWEFTGFSVDSNFDGLMTAHKLIEENGSVTGRTHRFMLVARKPQ